METIQKPKRAKRLRKEMAEKSASKPQVVEPDQIDEYDEAAIKEMVRRTPEVRFRHSTYFTDDEDRIIAASIKGRIQLYKVAASLKCCYNTLKKHIDNTPVLAEIVREAREIECGEIREAVDDLVKMRHPQVVMWRAKQLMPNEYGDAVETEEDDTRIVIGAVPDDLIAEADRALAKAAEKPPEVGLSAMMAVQIGEGGKDKGRSEKAGEPTELDNQHAQAQAETGKTETDETPEGEEEEFDEEDEDFEADGDFDFGGDGGLGF